MAADYSKLEHELTEMKAKLERELYMRNVRRLCKKQENLAIDIAQRKQIEVLTKQAAELEAKVNTVYCPQHSLKDHQVMGHLAYLLTVKDFFERDVATKEERIKQLKLETQEQLRKYSEITRQQAKIIKNKPKKTPEFIVLENMSNRMEQMNKRISKMKQENKQIVENINNMLKFKQQFARLEKDFRRKINYLKGKGQELLEKAVSSYEEKDEFMAKQKVFGDRRCQDLRKTATTENALNLILQKTDKNDEFAELQRTVRIDTRISEASDMIERGVTGLEPSIEGVQDLQRAISAAAGEDTPEKMKESFRISSDESGMTLSYLDEILKDIDRLQGDINNSKKDIKKLTQSMSLSDRKLRKKIELNQVAAQRKLGEADEASKLTAESKRELDSTIDIVKSLYTTYCPENSLALEHVPTDEKNVMDYLQKMEKKVLDYLICHEYIKMKEVAKESKPVILEDDKDEDEIQEVEQAGTLQPRILLSETDLHYLREMETGEHFLEFEALKERAVAVVAEDQAEKSKEETDTAN